MLSRWVRLGVAAGAVELGIVMLVMGLNATAPAGPAPGMAKQRAVVQSLPIHDALVAPSQEITGTPGTLLRSRDSIAAATKERTEVEICGFGTVTLQPDNPYPFQNIPLALRESALDTAEAVMLASDDIQVRAAALWMGMSRGKRDARGRIEQIARLAVGSQDPVVYALAIEACKSRTSNDYGTCHLISRAQWAHLDPDNAIPWLEVAAQARQNNEPDAEDVATRMAAHARYSKSQEGLLPTLVDRALGAHVTPLQRTLALSESWSAQAMWATSHAPHLQVGAAKAPEPPAVDLDLSCDSVNRLQDWMRRRHTGDAVLLSRAP